MTTPKESLDSPNAKTQLRIFLSYTISQVHIEHDLPLPMIHVSKTLENCVKLLDCRCKLASEARTKTRKETTNVSKKTSPTATRGHLSLDIIFMSLVGV